MKVFTEIDVLLGKKVFRDGRLEKLKERFSPQRITFFSIEFTNKERETSQCIVVSEDKVLDLIVEDMEKVEALLNKEGNKEIIRQVYEVLNKEKLICNEFSEEDISSIKDYSFLTAKPIVIWQDKELNDLFRDIFQRTSSIFFFTVNDKEGKAWLIKRGSNILTAASKIHSDLAKGFIRGEVYNIRELDNFKNFNEAKQKGILKVVDRDYIVEDGDVINIKFNPHF
jgi:ribosome-binding ATPase YchF (GTP1/OBG family)